ncbi:sodium-dependent transporter [Prevotella sp. PINT]|jgi:Na+-dependent transporters of the SNF family|uniref:sodium-dependent transporter n=1 Tax=Palleniella intestinalis TaxID=2736291 RepID=UPI001553B613|nr:sodium-dependent transporter [Palleniella intestinalis]NPD81786.1 sodium-dependent transporter [Palleniella intestinalis]
MDNRATFNSRIGAVLAAAGSAVGLGNIWRFPCETGAHGGAAFILLYIGFIITVAVPVLICEMALGRRSRTNCYATFKRLSNSREVSVSKPLALLFYLTGAMCVLAGFVLFSYYSVVAGWTLGYTATAGVGGMMEMTVEETGKAFADFSSDPVMPVVWLVAFVIITAGITVMGVQKGIERGSKIMMPVLFILLIVLAVCSLSLPDASKGLEFLFCPDFSKITTDVALSAMGQAFFTLSVGIGCLMTYASYFSNEENIVKDAFNIAAIDTMVAIVAGVIIFPAAMSVGINPDAGPSLVFITLPNVFNQAFGATPWLCYVVTLLFYLLLTMAALTSSISMLEITTAFVSERFGVRRRNAVAGIAIVTCFAGFACSMSFGEWSGVTVFGMGLFDLFDFFVAKFAMPIGGIFMCLLMRKFGEKEVTRMLTNDGRIDLGCFPKVFSFLVSWVIPVLILVIFVNELL